MDNEHDVDFADNLAAKLSFHKPFSQKENTQISDVESLQFPWSATGC